MKKRQALAGSPVWMAVLVVLWSPIMVGDPTPPPAPDAPEYQLLTNPSMEVYSSSYGKFHDVDCQVASGWQRFWHDGPEPCFMDTRVFAYSPLGGGWVERIAGETSQMILSTAPYTAGLWQRVTGLTPGVGYGFHAAMLTIFQTSAPPAMDGTMIKQVGIDPTGGIDPQAPSVVWSDPDDHDEGPWDVERRTAVYAQASAMTVFIRVISPYGAGPWPYLNQSFLDSAILALTATVSATSPAFSREPTFSVRWDNAVASPAGEIRWYDVQWLDEAEGMWHDWLTHTTNTQATFSGEQGHIYHFRARAWQRYPNGAHLCSPYRSEGDTQTCVGGWATLAGVVLSNERLPIAGATVVLQDTPYSAVSKGDGSYEVMILAATDSRTATVNHPVWDSPAPAFDLPLGPMETVGLTWILRPPDDAVGNGGFESGLDDWSPFSGQGPTPAIVADPVHTGHGALGLGGSAPTSFTSGVAQIATLAHSWEPALSFWYYPESSDTSGDRFNVILKVTRQTSISASPGELEEASPLAVTTRVYTPSLEAEGWQHLWFQPGSVDEYLDGTVEVRFQVSSDGDGAETKVYLDEVSLGKTPGGPFKSYLPIVRKR
jgi:hypothetical protein